MNAAPPKKRGRLVATSAQLWRLNALGLFAEAIEDDGRVYSERATTLIAQAVEQGLWTPKVRPGS